jgi:hypothetical protein
MRIGVVPYFGLTIRQAFVAAAMQGLVAKGLKDIEKSGDDWIIKTLALLSVEIADACLKREAETSEKQNKKEES